MSEEFKNLTIENIENEHLCCAIADKKHQEGVLSKKNWLKDRIAEGHTFRKLDEKGKVFIEYAKNQGKSGVCILTSKKKKPFLSEKKFMQKFDFEVVESVGEYELLALSFDGSKPTFSESVKTQSIDDKTLTIYYGVQCPYIPNCLEQIQNYCKSNKIPINLIAVDTLEKSKNLPCVFNNWAVFYNGKFETVHLLNEGYLKKMLGR